MATTNMVNLVGTIAEVGETKTFGKFTKKEIMLSVDGVKFSGTIPLTFKKENINCTDGFAKGDHVNVLGFVQANCWQKKDDNGKPVGEKRYFLEVECLKMSEFSDGVATEAHAEDEQSGDYDSSEMPF